MIRSRIAAGESIFTCAAASSIASGSPSNRAQIATTAATFEGSRVKSARTARARSTNKRTAGLSPTPLRSKVPPGGRSGSGSVPSAYSCSPPTWSAAWLDARIDSVGARSRSERTIDPAPASCSRLSRTSSVFRAATCSARRSSGSLAVAMSSRRARRISTGMRSASVRASRGTNATSVVSAPTTARAISWTSRVLPVPPEPVTVTSRASVSSCCTASTSASRPTIVVRCPGRFVTVRASERIGGKSAAWPSMTS